MTGRGKNESGTLCAGEKRRSNEKRKGGPFLESEPQRARRLEPSLGNSIGKRSMGMRSCSTISEGEPDWAV